MRFRYRSATSRYCCKSIAQHRRYYRKCIASTKPMRVPKINTLVPTEPNTTRPSSHLLLSLILHEPQSENTGNQVRPRPSASGGGPASTAPSSVSGRSASAWHWARSSSHQKCDWVRADWSQAIVVGNELYFREVRRGFAYHLDSDTQYHTLE